MAIFETPDQLYSYISELFEEIATLPEATGGTEVVDGERPIQLQHARLQDDANGSKWRIYHCPRHL